MRTHASWRADVALVPTRRPDMMASMLATSLNGRRIAVASAEPEDAHLTGMTRSLDRRLLALNLRPATAQVRKVA
jgi:hypothetical protein